jgi:hypothetical protein
MFDFDVVTGPGDLAKPIRPDAQRKQDLPHGTAAPQIVTSEGMKRQSAGDGDQPHPHRE